MKTVALLAGAAAIALLPLAFGGEFAGTDAQAQEAIAATGYRPWAASLWSPGAAEGLLFALQALVGAGVLAYVLRKRRG